LRTSVPMWFRESLFTSSGRNTLRGRHSTLPHSPAHRLILTRGFPLDRATWGGTRYEGSVLRNGTLRHIATFAFARRCQYSFGQKSSTSLTIQILHRLWGTSTTQFSLASQPSC